MVRMFCFPEFQLNLCLSLKLWIVCTPDGVYDEDIIHHDDDPGQAAEDEDHGDHDQNQGQPLLAFTEVTDMSHPVKLKSDPEF